MAEAQTFDAFAQRLLQLLDEGRFVATYKFAVLLGLVDVVIESTGSRGEAPGTVSTRALARAVIDIYWPHTRPFDAEHGTLRQNQSGQAEIVRLIGRFRERTVGDASAPFSQARAQAPAAFERLVRSVEWKLIEMPLGRLQLIGDQYDPFIYGLRWEQIPTAAAVSRDDFEGRLWLQPGAGDHLLRSAPLLRPLVQRTWALTVAKFNRLPDARLEEFLFGAERVPLRPVAPGLRELARDRCFYCDGTVGSGGQVDHFLPWARHIDNGLHNLVWTHGRCNGAKSAHLAAEVHVERWLARSEAHGATLDALAAEARWEADGDRTLAAARAIYLRLPDRYRLWRHAREFTAADSARLRALLTT